MKFFTIPKPFFDYENKEIVINPVIDFLKINTARLDWDKAQFSLDHDPTFYGCEAIEYDGEIPANAILRVKRFNMSDNIKQLQFNPNKTYEVRQPMPADWAVDKIGN
jgi:hypothetical protein